MFENKLYKIISKYLSESMGDRLSITKYSNLLCKIESGTRKPLIVKIFYSEPQFIRERIAYKILKRTDVKIPNLIEFGENGSEYWIVYDFVEGIQLVELDNKNIKINYKLFNEIGCNLGKIHSCDYSFLFTEREKSMYEKQKREAFVKGALNYTKNLVEKYPEYIGIFNQSIQIILDNIILISSAQDFLLTKGDFSPNNIIVNNGNLAAIIDFEYFMIENRYRDFILMDHYFEQDEQIKTSFIAGYSQGLNDKHFEFSPDKLLIVLLHYALECCFIADKKASECNIKRLQEIVKRFQGLKNSSYN